MYAKKLLGRNHDLSEDFVQETILKALKNQHRYTDDNLRGWLCVILRNEVFSYFRKKKNSSRNGANNSEITPPTQEIQIQWTEFETLFSTMTEDQRRSLQLICIEGRSYEEVAQMEGVPEGTIKSRVSRARSFLRERLDYPETDPISIGVMINDDNRRASYS